MFARGTPKPDYETLRETNIQARKKDYGICIERNASTSCSRSNSQAKTVWTIGRKRSCDTEMPKDTCISVQASLPSRKTTRSYITSVPHSTLCEAFFVQTSLPSRKTTRSYITSVPHSTLCEAFFVQTSLPSWPDQKCYNTSVSQGCSTSFSKTLCARETQELKNEALRKERYLKILFVVLTK